MFQDGVKKTISSGLGRTGRGKPSARYNQPWPAQTQRSVRKRNEKYDCSDTGFLRFPFSNFRYSLTLFSKFFASFPHGTCALSVSHPYLALDGIYHPLRAALPSNSTHVIYLLCKTNAYGSLTLYAALFQGTWRSSTQVTVTTRHLSQDVDSHMGLSRFSRPY